MKIKTHIKAGPSFVTMGDSKEDWEKMKKAGGTPEMHLKQP